MKITAGVVRGMPLTSPAGIATRPTAAKIREAVMSMLAPSMDQETIFLDLYAGSGALGLEAMSRGVGKAIFVENNPLALQNLKVNLLELERRYNTQGLVCPRYEIIGNSLNRALGLLEKMPAHIVWADPPYQESVEIMHGLFSRYLSSLTTSNGLFFLEAPCALSNQLNLLPPSSRSWRWIKDRRYGKTLVRVWNRLECVGSDEN